MDMKIYVKRFGSIPESDKYVGRKRRGHYDAYEIKRNQRGWYVGFLSIGGQCNTRGEPYLFENLNHDSVNYPESLGDYMDYLWRESKNKDERWIQQKLNVISKWISDVERTSPESKFWRFLK